MNQTVLQKIQGGLVVSCQALPDEALHSDFIMGRMALAAARGGAVGIRANGVADILAIQRHVELPVIGLIKRDYPGSEVYITPTLREIDELMEAAPAMIALDATQRRRPGERQLSELVLQIRLRYPQLQLMADIATQEEAQQAEQLGFDCLGTTLHGYTPETAGMALGQHDFAFLRTLLATVRLPVIAEGRVETPEMAAHCLHLGCHAVVVGGAITRPQQITGRFVQAMSG